MDWQLVLVALSAALALVYLGHRAWRTWAGTRSNCTSCGSSRVGCATSSSASSSLIPAEELTARLRRP